MQLDLYAVGMLQILYEYRIVGMIRTREIVRSCREDSRSVQGEVLSRTVGSLALTTLQLLLLLE